MMYPGTIYGDHTDDFVRMSMTQPVERIKIAMQRMADVVESFLTESQQSD